MKKFINLFLTIVIPVNLLFFLLASIYFLINFEFSKAIKLGILAGVLSGTAFSVIMTFTLLIMRKINVRAQEKKEKKKPKNHNSPIEENHIDKPLTKTVESEKVSNATDTFILLMDQELAYEVALYAVKDQDIGEITKSEKAKGSMTILSAGDSITLSITAVTRHTSKVAINVIPNNQNIQKLISYIKEKEHSFLDY